MTIVQIGHIDYKNYLFEHPKLIIRIIGEPTVASLITLLAEVRDNAGSVQTELGGGAHGHLGLVCDPDTYQKLVPGVEPYEHPKNPGQLVLAEAGLPQYQIAQAKDEHEESTRLFVKLMASNVQFYIKLLCLSNGSINTVPYFRCTWLIII